ncbi:uncharacterized protein I303_107123 [Kwoniella dejecticola CBS 10117]|uniref:Uncharacterized protein n=1 Tax=Kwoniella dejecticola CBS 10117 TaxID=1296121 RepID=A0A1A5ZYT5_9TREE|nr:uncharacterized protein I303_06525 [Kwoniella dejecticola CBS 10117]OBR82967.1 hypothetical protein I303_06525 [Kwoniella dejecticola CBS 10117]
MPPTFLDLDDEIILQIGDILHRDNEVPLPSFEPHWAGFEHSINPEIQKDSLSLRATCSRIKGLLSVKDLHIVTRQWSDIVLWNQECPSTVKQAVKRAIIDIPPEVGPLYYHWDEDHDLQEKDYEQILSVWTTLITFLSGLISLEELIIIESPLCRHFPSINIREHCLIPLDDILPALKSLAIECACMDCSAELPRLLIPTIPELQHLKIVHTYFEHLTSISANEEWLSRHPDKAFIPVETLAVKHRPNDVDPTNERPVMEDVLTCFPGIEELYITGHTEENNTPPQPTFILGATRKPADGLGEERWRFKPISEVEFDENGCYDWDVSTSGEDGEWLLTLDSLGAFKQLEVLDGVIEIVLPTRTGRLPEEGYSAGGTEYMSQRDDARSCFLQRETSVEEMIEAMRAAAREMVDHVPSLRKGYFWQWPYSEQDGEAELKWKRWTWTVSQGGRIEVDMNMEEIAVDNTKSLDGEQLRN